MNPVTMRGLQDELAVAMSVSVDYRHEPILQIGIGLFDDGEYLGYTIASKTLELSDFPALAIDQEGNIHVAWQEGAHGKNVYYATTSPQAAAELDKITLKDGVIFFLEAGIESLASIAFMPFIGLFWMLPIILFIGTWVFFRGQPSIKTPSFWVALISSGLIYYVFKMFTTPSLLTYVPFSAWLYMPEQYHTLVRLLTPLFIACLAGIIAYQIHKRYYGSIYILLLAFIITDALFTLMIFGVNFFGAV